jgi:hypothetical protein
MVNRKEKDKKKKHIIFSDRNCLPRSSPHALHSASHLLHSLRGLRCRPISTRLLPCCLPPCGRPGGPTCHRFHPRSRTCAGSHEARSRYNGHRRLTPLRDYKTGPHRTPFSSHWSECRDAAGRIDRTPPSAPRWVVILPPCRAHPIRIVRVGHRCCQSPCSPSFGRCGGSRGRAGDARWRIGWEHRPGGRQFPHKGGARPRVRAPRRAPANVSAGGACADLKASRRPREVDHGYLGRGEATRLR